MKWQVVQVKRVGLDVYCRPRLDRRAGCNHRQPEMMRLRFASSCIVVCAVANFIAGCITDGGDATDLAAAIPTDTYETCRAGSVLNEGVNFLSSGTGPGRVKLGMSECALIQVLGNPVNVIPSNQPGAGRHVSMIYTNADGTATSYLFVNNALREMNLVSQTPQTPQAQPNNSPQG